MLMLQLLIYTLGKPECQLYRLYPLRSTLASRFFSVIVGIIIAIFTTIYVYSVPLIKQKVFEIERHSSHLTLNNVFEIANRMYSNIEEYRTQGLQAHQQQLKVAVSLTEAFIKSTLREAHKQGVSEKQALQQAFTIIRDFNYGNKDYVWIADYQGLLLSHPDPRFHGKDSAGLLDEDGQPIVPTIVKRAIQDGEGFYRYKWQRLSENEPLDKVSYVKNYPEWGFVIGSGVYLDDLEKEFTIRKSKALEELRAALQDIKVASTGYLFVFDSKAHMLIHPNPNIDRTQFQNLKNPLTQQSIAADLMKVADTGQELHYQWDKPTDPGHYIYEKLSLVRYLKGFDWYICSSVYLDELRSSSEILSNRLLTIAFITMLASIGLAFFFINRITRPLKKLANTALQVSQGDLSAKSGIQQKDEIGILARSFDSMVERLKTNIDSLDTQVRQRTEALLETRARAQRMHAVGQLAGGLAHDFNNLLSIILGNLLLAKEQYSHTQGLEQFLHPAIRATRRGADITQRLLAFARRQPLQPGTIDVAQLVEETLELLRGSLPNSIQLHYQTEHGPLLAHVDPSHLENTLINLALNARDAMPQGGKIHLFTGLLAVTEPLEYDEPVSLGTYVIIRVSDNGTGFSQDALKLAFEPFYSTKTNNRNSGLGLSMVYGFVKQSNGYIQIASQTGVGATISLLLPVDSSGLPLLERHRDAQHPLHELAGKLFLLVEDNADVRAVVRQQLINLGLHVIEAENATEADAMIQKLPHLHGMVSDIMLPGVMDGRQLAALLHQHNPRSIILLMSGYVQDFNQFETDERYFVLLHKPFDQETLKQALWQAIAACQKGE